MISGEHRYFEAMMRADYRRARRVALLAAIESGVRSVRSMVPVMLALRDSMRTAARLMDDMNRVREQGTTTRAEAERLARLVSKGPPTSPTRP